MNRANPPHGSPAPGGPAPSDVNGWIARANALQAAGRHAEELEAWEHAISLDGSRAALHADLGRARILCGRKQEALSALTRATELDPREPKAWANRAHVLVSLGRFDEARRSCFSALAVDHRSFPAWANAANASLDEKRNAEALFFATMGLLFHPGSPELAWNAGLAADRLELRALALAHYRALLASADGKKPLEQAVRIARERVPVIEQLGRSQPAGTIVCDRCKRKYGGHLPRCMWCGAPKPAQAAEPSAADAFAAAREHDAKGQKDAAVDAYRLSVALGPRAIAPLFNLGVSLEELGRSIEALPLYRTLIEIDPSPAQLHGQLALCLVRLSRFDDALEAAEECLARDPSFVLASRAKGHACEALGRFDDARRAFERVLSVTPEERDVRARLPRACLFAKDYPAAIAAADEAMRRTGEDAGHLWTRGRALFYLGRFDPALEALERAIAIGNPRFGEPWADRAACLAALGREAEALECIEQASKRDPYSGRIHLQRALAHERAGRAEARREFEIAVMAFEDMRGIAARHPERVIDPHESDEEALARASLAPSREP